MRESVRAYVVCPKCKTAELEFAEVSEAYEKWTQNADGVIVNGDESGALLGGVVRVEAVCLNPSCNHKWTVRRAKDITDLPNWPEGGEVEEVDTEPETEVEEVVAKEEVAKEEVVEAPPIEEAPPAAEPSKKTGKGKGNKSKQGKKQAA